MKFHPLADIFPMMTDDEFRKLVKDIDENGQAQPIFTYQGQIIDGRNRFKACEKLNLVAESIEFEGDEAELVPFILSLNLHRRHLSESQRAVVASKVANLERGRPETNVEISTFTPVSQLEAAKMLNVSRDSVIKAKAVLDHGTPELVEAVERGDVAVSTAATIAKTLPKEAQNSVLEKATAIGERVTTKLVEQTAKTIQEHEEYQRIGHDLPVIERPSNLPPQPQVPAESLWLWDHLNAFSRNNVLDKDINEIVQKMTPKMREGFYEIAPVVAEWLDNLKTCKQLSAKADSFAVQRSDRLDN